MDLKIACPNCDQHLLVDATGIGQQVTCPTCSKRFLITRAQTVPPSTKAGEPISQSGGASPHRILRAVLLTATVVVLIATAIAGGYYFYQSHNHPAASGAGILPVRTLGTHSQVPLRQSNSAASNQPVVTNTVATQSVAAADTEAWRSDMGIFVKEVLALAQRSSLPSEEAWTIEGRDGLKRLGPILTSKGVDVGFVPQDAGMDGEFSTELLKRFGTGAVSWRGAVTSATNDVEKELQIIEIAFPTHDGAVQIQPLKLEIPFSKLPRDNAPKVGDAFAFSGNLQGNTDDPLFKQGVGVIYWFAASQNPGKKFVVVSLADVSPVTKLEPPTASTALHGTDGKNGTDDATPPK